MSNICCSSCIHHPKKVAGHHHQFHRLRGVVYIHITVRQRISVGPCEASEKMSHRFTLSTLSLAICQRAIFEMERASHEVRTNEIVSQSRRVADSNFHLPCGV